MLLFIAPLVTIFQSTLLNFNTSHVTVYPYGILHYYLFVSYFNTSHVTVYPLQLCTALGPSLISIHLMLLFIASALFLLPPFGIISIHLMLLFIKVENPKIREETHFNTSHVTVYLYAGVSDPEVSSISIHLMLLFICCQCRSCRHDLVFQYISCYCLSVSCMYLRVAHLFISIHLMLLFIWIAWISTHRAVWISIHLMLLFIITGFFYFLPDSRFQYISCYCLSCSFFNLDQPYRYFNTSHVTVYRNSCYSGQLWKIFQYISCYCLSNSV